MNSMILVGSRAANRYNFDDFPDPKDYDIICKDKGQLVELIKTNRDSIQSAKLAESGRYYRVKLKTGERFEFELPIEGDNAESIKKIPFGPYNTTIPFIGTINIAHQDDLFWLKWSHIVRPIHFAKNIRDYHILRRNLRPVELANPPEWVKIRRSEVERRYPINVSLDMSNDEFFAKSQRLLGRVLEHDDLHRATMFGMVPMFELMKRDKTKASVERNIWDSWSLKSRLNSVREECFAIALERVIIPEYTRKHGSRALALIDDDLIMGPYANGAYRYALMRICTTLTSGWFRQFAIDNYLELENPRKRFGEDFKYWAIRNKK
jgi:hypothetical protein